MDKKEIGRLKRHRRLRVKIAGTKERPRMSVHRSHANLHVQLIDDTSSTTLLAGSTLDKSFKEKLSYGGNIKSAELLGETLAEKAKLKGITKVVFDRGGYLYHGRVKAVAEAARKNGLIF